MKREDNTEEEKGENNMRIGYPDIPIEKNEQDQFSTSSYVKAMSEFILECDTPMTIAIQGDWGTGKTSMMNMVEEQIKEKVCVLKFNTWAYSQFHLGDQLPQLLLSRMADQLTRGTPTKLQEYAKRVLKMAGHIAIERMGVGADTVLDELEVNEIDALEKLRIEFQDSISKRAKDTMARRVVIFVDDLDRLQPERAVELLETMKVFLDCKQCVFVLAVDYGVVTQGIRAKYGDTLTEEKGKSFFDKIIQLPFKMPVEMYNMDIYLRSMFSGFADGVGQESDIAACEQILQAAVGKNPRSIKRMVNSFTITEKVASLRGAYNGDNKQQKGAKQKVLLALLAMQLAYEPIYRYIIEHAEDLLTEGTGVIACFKTPEKCEALLGEIYQTEGGNLNSVFLKQAEETCIIFSEWVEQLVQCVSPETAEETLKALLSFSTITSGRETVPGMAKTSEMTREEFLAKVKNTEALLDYYKVLDGFVQEQNCRIEQFGGSYYHVRLMSPEGKCICDGFPRKGNEMSVDFFLPSREDREAFRIFINSEGQLHMHGNMAEKGAKSLSVYQISNQLFVQNALEWILQK